MVAGISHHDAKSFMINRSGLNEVKLPRPSTSSAAADREQEREIDRRQEHQSIVVRIDDDDAAMMPVDSDSLRMVELKHA